MPLSAPLLALKSLAFKKTRYFPKYNFFHVQEEKNKELMEIRVLLPKFEEKFVSMSLKVPSPVIISVSIVHRVLALIHLSQP